MTSKKMVTIHFTAQVTSQQRENYWAAYVEPFAMTAYGETREDAERRLKEGVDFFMKNAPDLRKYLDSHGVPHYVTEDDAHLPVRQTLPVTARVETPVYA